MKLLIDENLPKRLKRDFPEHQVLTVREKGWNGKNNGALLRAMMSEGFNVLLTFDKNIQHQQNIEKYPVAVFLLTAKNSSYARMKMLVPEIRKRLEEGLLPGVTVISSSL